MALTPSSGWSKYSDITVGSPSSDYQMKIDLRRGSGTNDPSNGILYDENNCYYSDMRDVQINSTDEQDTGTRLPQWTEEVSSGTKRVFWVKTNGASHIYIFVGNSSASEYSDGDATFIFFDDFDTFDTNVWSGNTANFSASSGAISSTSSNTWIYNSNVTFSNNKLRTKVRLTSGARGANNFRINTYSDTYGYSNIEDYGAQFRYPNGDFSLIEYDAGTWSTLDTTTKTYDTDWFITEITAYGSSLSANIDSGSAISATDTTYTTGGIGLATHTLVTPGTDKVEWDWIFVAKYASAEPSFTNFGAWTDVSGSSTLTKSIEAQAAIFQRATKYSEAQTNIFERTTKYIEATACIAERKTTYTEVLTNIFNRATKEVEALANINQISEKYVEALSAIFERATKNVEALTDIYVKGEKTVTASADIYEQGTKAIEALSALYDRTVKSVEATTAIFQRTTKSVEATTYISSGNTKIVEALTAIFQRLTKLVEATATIFSREIKEVEATTAIFQRDTKQTEALATIFRQGEITAEMLSFIAQRGSLTLEALTTIAERGSATTEALAAIYERNTKTVEATTYIATPSTDTQYSEAHEVDIQKTGSHEVNIIKQEGIIVRRY